MRVPRNRNNRTGAKVFAKQVFPHRGGHENELQMRVLWQHALENNRQKVSKQIALVQLVDDDVR